MPPVPAPVLRLAVVVVVVFLCLTVPPVEDLAATALDGDLPPAPTFVALGDAGCFPKRNHSVYELYASHFGVEFNKLTIVFEYFTCGYYSVPTDRLQML